MDFSIIVPVKNESGNVKPLVEAIHGSLRSTGREYEVVFVDGASNDGTREEIESCANDYPVQLVDQQTETGLAGACLDGALAARAEVLVVMDGDGSHPAEAVARLASAVLDDKADLAVGSRYISGGKTVGWPLRRQLASRIATLSAWPLVDIADPMSGFFCVSKKYFLDCITPETSGYKVLFEILVKLGSRICVEEIPITFRERERGKTKLGKKVIRDYLEQIFRLSGALVTWKSATRFGAVGFMGMIIDIATVTLVIHYFKISLKSAHFFGFALATLFNYIFNLKWAFHSPSLEDGSLSGRYARFLFVSANSLLVRCGIILLLKSNAFPDWFSLLAGIAAVSAANYIGYSLFVFNESPAWMKDGLQFRLLAIAVAVYLFLLRAVFLGTIGLIPEEAYYWNYSNHLALGYYDHPPLTAWAIKAGTFIFGVNLFGVRVFFFIACLIMAYYVYRLCRLLYGKTAGIAAVALLSANPLFLGAGFLAMTDILITTAWAASLYYFWRAGYEDDASAWWKLGVAAGIGLLSKYTMALFVPAAAVLLLLNKDSRKWFSRMRPYIAAAAALLIFAPVIYWNSQNNFISFKFQSSRLAGGEGIELKRMLNNLLMLLTPSLIIPLIPVTAYIYKKIKNNGMSAKKEIFTAVMVIVPFLVFLKSAFSVVGRINWTIPMFIPFFMTAGYLLQPGAGKDYVRSLRSRIALYLFLFLVLFDSISLNYLSGKIEVLPYSEKTAMIMGWDDFAQKVAVKYSEHLKPGNAPPVIAVMGDKYRITSELEYYFTADKEMFEKYNVHKPEVVSQNLFGKQGLMYGIWNAPEQYKGRNFIVIFRKDKHIPAVQKYFSRVGKTDTIEQLVYGKPVRKYTIFYGENYSPR